MKNKVVDKIDKILGKDQKSADIIMGLKKIYQSNKLSIEKQDQVIKALESIKDLPDNIQKIITLGQELSKITPELLKKEFVLPEVVKVKEVNPVKQKKIQQVSMEKPSWYRDIDFSFVLGAITKSLSSFFKVKIQNQGVNEAIPVRLTDGREFYKAVFSATMGGFDTSILAKQETLEDIYQLLIKNPSTLISYNVNDDAVYIDETENGITFRTTITRDDMEVSYTLPISASIEL